MRAPKGRVKEEIPPRGDGNYAVLFVLLNNSSS